MKILPAIPPKRCEKCGSTEVSDRPYPVLVGTLKEVLDYLFERQDRIYEPIELTFSTQESIAFDGRGYVELDGRAHRIRLTGWNEPVWSEEEIEAARKESLKGIDK